MATGRPEHVVGIHFFNPVPVLAAGRARPVAAHRRRGHRARARPSPAGPLGKRAIRAQDRAGFIVNALLIPYLLSAIRMFESGFAIREDIDTGHGARAAPTRWARWRSPT